MTLNDRTSSILEMSFLHSQKKSPREITSIIIVAAKLIVKENRQYNDLNIEEVYTSVENLELGVCSLNFMVVHIVREWTKLLNQSKLWMIHSFLTISNMCISL